MLCRTGISSCSASMCKGKDVARPVDRNGWKNAGQYDFFSGFSNPCYAVTCRVDVTDVYRMRNGRHLYSDLLYLVASGLFSVEALHLRRVNGLPVFYETLRPVFTVAKEEGAFESCRVEYDPAPAVFTQRVKEAIAQVRAGIRQKGFADDAPNDIYFSCLPWLDFTGLTQPLPDDGDAASVPRICWGRITEEADGRFRMALSASVSHALVSGRQICDAFAAVQNRLDRAREILLEKTEDATDE